MSFISNFIPSSTLIFIISSTISFIFSSFRGMPFMVVSMSIVVLFSMPIKDDMRNPPFITKLFLYFDLDSLSKNLSKKYICKTSCDFRFFFSAMLLILPYTSTTYPTGLQMYFIYLYPKATMQAISKRGTKISKFTM